VCIAEEVGYRHEAANITAFGRAPDPGRRRGGKSWSWPGTTARGMRARRPEPRNRFTKSTSRGLREMRLNTRRGRFTRANLARKSHWLDDATPTAIRREACGVAPGHSRRRFRAPAHPVSCARRVSRIRRMLP
jgi:hypothetical protein